MKILWLSDARQDLKNLFLYILDRNPAAARRIRKRIYSAVKGLADNPNIGRPGRVFGTRELVISQTSYSDLFFYYNNPTIIKFTLILLDD